LNVGCLIHSRSLADFEKCTILEHLHPAHREERHDVVGPDRQLLTLTQRGKGCSNPVRSHFTRVFTVFVNAIYITIALYRTRYAAIICATLGANRNTAVRQCAQLLYQGHPL